MTRAEHLITTKVIDVVEAGEVASFPAAWLTGAGPQVSADLAFHLRPHAFGPEGGDR